MRKSFVTTFEVKLMRAAVPSADPCLICIRIVFRFANDGRFDENTDENGFNNSSKYLNFSYNVFFLFSNKI